jgi:hypothetical protein
MPNQYKPKICPQCYTEHRKRGPFCSKVCSNKARIVTQETRDKKAESMRAYMTSGNETAEKIIWSLQATKEEREDGLPLPQTPDPIGNNQFVSGRDLWTTDD